MIAKLSAEVERILSDPRVVKLMADSGAEAQSSTPDGFTRFMREESARMRKVIKVAGIEPR